MSLTKQPQTVEITRGPNKEGVERIQNLIFRNTRFNYVFLETPRPSNIPGGNPSYDTELIIESQEAWEAISEYFNEVYNDAVLYKWQNRRPTTNNMNTPFKTITLDDKGEYRPFEEGAIVRLAAKSNNQPQLLLRLDGAEYPTPYIQEEGGATEFYSGMIGEAVISFWAYPKAAPGQPGSPKDGVRAYVNAVCKTDHGDPIFTAGRHDYTSLFGGVDPSTPSAVFAAPKAQAPVAQAPVAQAPKAQAPKAQAPQAAAPINPLPQAPQAAQGNLLNTIMGQPAQQGVQAAPEAAAPTVNTTLDALLKKA